MIHPSRYIVTCMIIAIATITLNAKQLRSNQACDPSHTFFVPRQVTTNSMFELALNNYHWYHERTLEDRSFYFGIYATPFFQQSTRGEKIARYFLRGGQESLVFNEINEDPKEICSLWFGLESDLNTQFFNSIFCMNPRRRAYGSYFNAYFTKEWGDHALWFNIAFAVMRAEHSLRMNESLREIAGPLSNFTLGTIDQFTSVIRALNNPEWNFGKFSPCALKRFGVDDIQVKLGYDWFYSQENEGHISPYIVGTIPTGKRQRSDFIFEPLVGSKHGSFGVGINVDFTLYEGDGHYLTWLFDFKYRYVFSANQCRSFDLCKNGDWSRYLLVVPKDQHLAAQPGINLFSLEAKVSPRNTIDLWSAFNLQWKEFNVELGYSFWWRQKEHISLDCFVSKDFGIFDLAGMNLVPQSASNANISQTAIGPNKAPSDASFVTIRTRDLDIDSAEHPMTLSSTVYAAFDWCPSVGDHSLLLGLGGQYEFAHRQSALEQWGIWGKLGISF